ncbi:MAG: hypothetical protein ACYDEH_01030 [Acidimicrobiales bacterium]
MDQSYDGIVSSYRADWTGDAAMSTVVFQLDEVERYDAIVDALAGSDKADLCLPTGEVFNVTPELLTVIVEAAQFLARDKAVSVISQSRHRFL